MIKDNVIYIDVDDTLILSKCGELLSETSTINYALIDKIKKWKEKGRSIIVWTSNSAGVEHARKAVKRCGIEDLVDLCLPKPHTIVDDDHLEYYRVINPRTLK